MKLNLEIELDWIDDEMSLDDTVKQNVIDSVVNKIQKGVEEQVESTINKTIGETVVAKINEKTEELFDDFMNKEVVINDAYGSVINTYPNVTAVIKNRFDNFMTQTVDKNGKASTSPYDTKSQRIEFIIDKQLKTFADKFTTDAVKRVSEEIQQHVKDGLTTKLGSELMKVLKVEEMLSLNGKKK
jgi:hypothetical protein